MPPMFCGWGLTSFFLKSLDTNQYKSGNLYLQVMSALLLSQVSALWSANNRVKHLTGVWERLSTVVCLLWQAVINFSAESSLIFENEVACSNYLLFASSSVRSSCIQNFPVGNSWGAFSLLSLRGFSGEVSNSSSSAVMSTSDPADWFEFTDPSPPLKSASAMPSSPNAEDEAEGVTSHDSVFIASVFWAPTQSFMMSNNCRLIFNNRLCERCAACKCQRVQRYCIDLKTHVRTSVTMKDVQIADWCPTKSVHRQIMPDEIGTAQFIWIGLVHQG